MSKKKRKTENLLEIPKYLQNRELSWLRFNERVLEEAADPKVPLLERLKFISIFTSNLDEFFMIRVGSLHDLTRLKKTLRDPRTGLSAEEQIAAIVEIMPAMYEKRDKLYREVMSELAKEDIEELQFKDLSQSEQKAARRFFRREIQPLLSPQIIDIHHPFPFLENKKIYIFAELLRSEQKMFGLVPIRKSFPQYFILPGVKFRYILLADLMTACLDEIFPESKINKSYCLSITRNFDMTDSLDTKDEFEDYQEYMKLILKKRKRLSPVRLEVQSKLNKEAREFLLDKLELERDYIFISEAPLRLNYVFKLISEIPSARCHELSYPAFQSYDPLAEYRSSTLAIRQGDKLLSYPYEDIAGFVRLLEEAAADPDCVAIKITIYRLAENSKIVRALVQAAENGIEVTVFMELKARFDEEANIHYSNILYEAGCQIIYGFRDYKIHSKLLLITYNRRQGGLSYITQVGTGNYNENTARQYTDFSLMTAETGFGLDARDFFHNMAIGKLDGKYKYFLQSPTSFKAKILELIEREKKKGPEGYIFCKLNSLTDKDICEALASFSQAGGRARLIIRGIACLLPGIPEFTENIEIRSIVGRFLEHGRVYIFGQEQPDIYIASADLMTRNTERRVEIAVPILSTEIKERLTTYLERQWHDCEKGRQLQPNGRYAKIACDGETENSSQDYFLAEARAKAQLSKPYPQLKTARKRESFWQRLRYKLADLLIGKER
ncbi:MAG: polyphosphate kinase 1 [Eubacteriales bacterium]|nr:polyphosphate kinase 1 [Eubacteriales bacterium]